MAFELIINNGGKKMIPCVLDGVDVEWTRQGSAGQMTFTVLKDAGISFVEGNAVTLCVDGVRVFCGFVVKKSRGKDHQIEVTCLDQLFYLAQNQTRYVCKNQEASTAIKILAQEKDVKFIEATSGRDGVDGSIVDTEYYIEKHRFDSPTSYLDIMQTLLDVTLAHSGKMFVLYDDFGALTLKNIDDMKYVANGLALLVNSANAENFDYESSIENSYNEVSLWQPENGGDNSSGEGKLYEAAHVVDPKNQKAWGMLTYYEELDKDVTKENAKLKAQQLLELHNQVKRKLSLKGVLDDPRIRPGCSVLVDLNLGDVAVRKWFMVESVQHHFKNDYSTMDLDVVSSKGFVL